MSGQQSENPTGAREKGVLDGQGNDRQHRVLGQTFQSPDIIFVGRLRIGKRALAYGGRDVAVLSGSDTELARALTTAIGEQEDDREVKPDQWDFDLLTILTEA